MRRLFRRISDGQWAAAELRDVVFNDDGTDFADRLAVNLGLAAGSLEVVEITDDAIDPRSGPLLVEPAPEIVTPPPPVISPAQQAVRDLLAKADADITAAELKQMVLFVLRRMRDRGTL